MSSLNLLRLTCGIWFLLINNLCLFHIISLTYNCIRTMTHHAIIISFTLNSCMLQIKRIYQYRKILFSTRWKKKIRNIIASSRKKWEKYNKVQEMCLALSVWIKKRQAARNDKLRKSVSKCVLPDISEYNYKVVEK